MNSIIELVVELAVGVILLFAAGYTFARISGYGEFYDKTMYDDEGEIDVQISGKGENYDQMQYDDGNSDLIIKNNNNNDDIKNNNNNIAHHFAI